MTIGTSSLCGAVVVCEGVGEEEDEYDAVEDVVEQGS